ncbi:hypothetical protein [Methylocella silvestris]|uniref:hypothetical protein n=1 Tax=Methylocella silvestris TaxID=199596 RepID=UPI0011AF2358|nr:hypothetical protein [Methylocella silvestris]
MRFRKRPKSREETPKEGIGDNKRCRTAINVRVQRTKSKSRKHADRDGMAGAALVSASRISRAFWMARQNKEAARDFRKRPKSREETPKEGIGDNKRCRTAIICTCDAQKASAADLFSDGCVNLF